MTDHLPEESFLVFGLGVTNEAVARSLVAHGRSVVLADDGPAPTGEALADELGLEVHRAPGSAVLEALVDDVQAVVPTPGLPESHRLFELSDRFGRAVLSEFDLAAAFDERPVLAVTGTNGKTTTTAMVGAMLAASGIVAPVVGNTDVPLAAAIDDVEPEVFVVEASSFRLAHSRWFRPRVATFLNFAEDHLNVHRDLERYRWAKERIFADQTSADTAVLNAQDPVVADTLAGRVDGPVVVRYGLDAVTDDRPVEFHERDGALRLPDGSELIEVSRLWSSLPHDRSNALAASATALAGGATVAGVRSALLEFRGLPHRVELVAERDGVRYYDDSKATAPHATAAAVQGFESVVLIAGGFNKGLDLSVLGALSGRVRHVVGIGDAGPEVLAALGDRPGTLASSMTEAVEVSAGVARSGDAVLLSPGCASFDWYESYAQRGDDFARSVRRIVLGDDA